MAKMTVIGAREKKEKRNLKPLFTGLGILGVVILLAVVMISVLVDADRTKTNARNAVLTAEAKTAVLEGQINAEHRAIEKKNVEIKKLNRFSNAVIERLKIVKYESQDLRVSIKKLKEEIEEYKASITALEAASKDDAKALTIALAEKLRKIGEIEKLKIDIKKLNVKLIGKDEQIKTLTDAVGMWSEKAVELQRQLEKTKKKGLFTVIGTAIAGAIGWLL